MLLVEGIIQRHFVMSVNLGNNNCVSPSILLIIVFWFNSQKVLQNKWQEKILRTEVSDRKNRSTLSPVHHYLEHQRIFSYLNLDSLRQNRDREREPDKTVSNWILFLIILSISRTDSLGQGSLLPLSLSFHIAISMVYSFIVRREILAFPRLLFLV